MTSRLTGLRWLAGATLGLVLWATHPQPAYALEELRSFVHPKLGKVSLLVPVEWTLQERLDPDTLTVFVRFLPPASGLFDFEVAVAETAALRNEALNRRDLEAHVRQVSAAALPQSVEGQVTPQRFGLRRDESLYARLTDKAPAPDEFLLVTKGVRLQGRRAMLFTLYSNDTDGALLKRALDLVSSFTFEPFP